MIRVLKFILLFIAFPLYIKANTEKLPINRHFIIVVDQTINSSNNNLSALYKGLSCWLQGKDPLQYIERNASVVPSSLNFDQQNDAISLFAFGMPGNGHKMNSEYGRIHSECWNGSKSEQYVFKDVTKSLIHKRERYINGERLTAYNGQQDKMSLSNFLRDCLRPLFNSQDPLHIKISNNSGITMSHFVYPLIMNFISKEETANEYYLILVSDFKSGQYSNNDQDDKNTLYSLISGKSHIMAYFERQIKSMRAPFVQAEYLHFQAGDLGARGVRLIHKDIVMKSQLYLNSSLELSQKRGNQFNLSDANITFDKDKATTIDSIGVMIMEGKKLLSYRTIVRGDDKIAKLLTEKREYEIPAQTSMDLGLSSLGDITVKYIFFTMSHDSEGNSVLPVSLTSQQIIAKESITYIDQEFRRTMTIVLITLSFIIIIAIMYWLGRKKKVVVNISRFAQKYVNVTKDRGAVELPCWFYVKDNNLNRIKVSGSVECCRKMTIGGMTKLYVRLQEAQPNGFSYYVNGKECNNFLYIPLKGNKFSFELDININPDIVDVRLLHTCSVMMDFKVETSIGGLFKHTDAGISPEAYDFYFIEDLGRAWVGFDPGTSGSCVAVGNPSGALNAPSISLVEVTRGRTMTKIIPSRIIFNKSFAGKSCDMLLPGIDYEYGIAAERNWRASRNMPRFQSIKKLLGYKKAEEDKIGVTAGGTTLKFSGVDLAHMLMRGLDRDLTEYVNNMSGTDRQRVTDNGVCPQRAVVAIPNNYTLPKIEDMIASVERLGKFKEIRFIYEAEGVLFNYLRKTFGQKQSGTETVMVYDMGGATINLTVFRITYTSKNGSTYYNISTLGRIGYAVGGDNIDVALMEYIFTMASDNENKRHDYEKKHKTEILETILDLKKNIINAYRGNKDPGLIGALLDKEGFCNFANRLLDSFGGIDDLVMEGEDFTKKILQKILDSKELQDFVYSRVKDAVVEILKYPEVKPVTIDKLLFAGRSTMFPGIRSMVETFVKSHSRRVKTPNIFDDEEVKTSVAYGACWYGIYNGLVTLDNSRLTSAYGFKQTTGTNSSLKVLLNQNSVFGDDNMVHGSIAVESLFDGADDNTAYGKLVSECLDFLEFIYGYGDAIEVKSWNVASNISALKNSASKGHQVLGKSLENFALNLGVKDIYLIYYNGVLIGGTSPFTLVYTSPNWQRVKNITNACGLAGNQLFPDYSQPNTVATPLYRRDLGFRTMLTRYYVAFRMVPGMKDTSFFKYIYHNQDVYDTEMKKEFVGITGANPYDVAKFRNDYPCVKADMTEIDILGLGGAQTLFLATKTATPGPNPGPVPSPNATISDDYKIAATVDNGNINRPLVLFEGGITGATYVADKPLPNGVDIVRNQDESLDSRILPGGQNIKYPYLTDTDFLQEKIIKVGYKVDTDNFMTFGIETAGNGDYLLPLRKELFEYFKPSDFVNDSVQGLAIKLVELDEETVEAHLFIPVQFKGRPYIELVHTYYKDDIVELKNYPNVFSVGVFPSYRILGNAVPNIYSVLVLDAKKQVTTRYYALKDGKVEVVADVVSKSRLTNGGRYDELKQAFDACEVEVNGAKALLLPNFKEITPADGGGDTVVGIDFGTTNTYICFSTDGGGAPESLEITRNDMQVLMLNKINLDKGNYGDDYRNSMYMMSPYITSLDREFVPLLLGKQSNVAYPFRTVTCEVNDSQNGFDKIASPQLFADINIGFNFLNEFVDLPKEKYNTNIKWDIEEGNTDEPLTVKQNRVKAFCYQNAWMIKNKLMLLSTPRTSFKVFITFPYTMKRTVRNEIADYWEEAFDKIMGEGNVEVERVTESIAPYFSMISNDGNFTDNALNIDIGGGTTDMLFADVENKIFYYTSSKFAGDDIWGDGKHLVDNKKKDNGFVKDFEDKLANHSLLVSNDRCKGYEQYKSLVKKSSDLMSYIFRYEDEFKYTGYIRKSQDKLMPILCVHLGAILYHVAQVLTERHITIPSTITFSGMGAKYIHIISDNERDVKDIVKMLLSTFMESLSGGGKSNMPRNFKVKFQANAKEVTAQGAMLVNHDSLQEIREYEEEPLCVFGIDKKIDDELEYADVPKFKDDVIRSYGAFLDAFVRNKRVVRFFKEEFGIIFKDSLIEKLEQEASQSFDLMSKTLLPTMLVRPCSSGH